MKVSTRVHYGLRAMTELARSYAGPRPRAISEIARSENLPPAYLEQLVGELRKAGLVEGTRGMRGGYRLARPPGEVTVGDVYRVLEGEVAPVDCLAESYLPGACSADNGCLSQPIWHRVQVAILSVLDSTTLEDVLRAEERVAHARGGASLIPPEELTTPTTADARREHTAGAYAHS